MKNVADLIKEIIRHYGLEQPVPGNVRSRMSAGKRTVLAEVLKEVGNYSLYFGLLLRIYFRARMLGLGISLTRCAAVFWIMVVAGVTGMSAAAYALTSFVRERGADMRVEEIRNGGENFKETGDREPAESIEGQWNYTTSRHWVKGQAPAGGPARGVLEITRSGKGFAMEIKSGMVINPPRLRYYTGARKGSGYVFSNSASVDNEGGVAANTCELKPAGRNGFIGKTHSRYSMGGMSFTWGFDITLSR